MADGLVEPMPVSRGLFFGGRPESNHTHGRQSPALQHTTQNIASSPRPVRMGTPARHAPGSAANVERNETGSRAASVHPEATFTMPNEAPSNGAPVRQYINTKLTGPLLEGMKMIAKEQ